MAKKKRDTKSNKNGATLGFEATLWQAADKLRNNLDAAEYKHVVLGLIFLKYISDTFEERYDLLLTESANPQSELYVPDETARVQLADDRDEYLAENIFYVPQEARWSYLQANAKRPEIGTLIDKAMIAIEGENASLKGVLPKNYARQMLDKRRLGELVDLIGRIGLGEEENRSKDILGRVYEYFLSQFASAEGKRGGQFYTPRSVLCGCSLRCSRRTRDGCTIRAAGRAGCSSRAKPLSKRMAADATTSQFSGRSPTQPLGNWRR